MKTLITTLTLLSLFTGLVLVIAARTTTSVSNGTEVVVLRDITEKNALSPNPDEILSLFDLTANAYSGAIFRFAEVSDVSYNQTTQVKLPATGKWLSNEFDRQREIDTFQNGVRNILKGTQTDSLGRYQSSVYLPVARELTRLSQSTSRRRILIVYSDLMENETDISLYHLKEFQLLVQNKDSLAKKFEAEEALPLLEGIEVYLIYQPTNPDKDNEYKVLSEFYRTILEGKGAKVTIEANLQN